VSVLNLLAQSLHRDLPVHLRPLNLVGNETLWLEPEMAPLQLAKVHNAIRAESRVSEFVSEFVHE
jgi:hypothetical protein